MRRLLLPALIVLAICFLFSLPASAGKFSAGDFPLRVLILFAMETVITTAWARNFDARCGGWPWTS